MSKAFSLQTSSGTGIVDSQVHLLKEGDPHRMTHPAWKATPTAAEAVGAMDRLGIEAAILVNLSFHGADNSYVLSAAADNPGRFAVVGTIEPVDRDLEETIATWRAVPERLGFRLLFHDDYRVATWLMGGFDRILRSADRCNVPLNVWAPGHLPELGRTVRSYPDVQFVVDHLGLAQPSPTTSRDDMPFARLPELLKLARYPNVAVKLTGAPTLSIGGYPYSDLWPSLHAIIDSFGAERVMWGSDWARTPGITYQQHLDYFLSSGELSATDREKLMGETARRIYRWHQISLEGDVGDR